MKPLPSQEQLQEWVHLIEPDSYFERYVDRPGFLVLRVKNRPRSWQGLHLIMSTAFRNDLRNSIQQLVCEQTERVQIHASYPAGDSWTRLYLSGIDFKCSLLAVFRRDSSLEGHIAWVRFYCDKLVVFLSNQAASTLCDELKHPPEGGQKSYLALVRDAKPFSPPQGLWFWNWGDT